MKKIIVPIAGVGVLAGIVAMRKAFIGKRKQANI